MSLLASAIIIIVLVFSLLPTLSFSIVGIANADSVTSAIPVGNGPLGLAYDSHKGNMYVTNFSSNIVSVSATNTVIATIPMPSGSPSGVVFDSYNGEW